jgi:hypothetical protein
VASAVKGSKTKSNGDVANQNKRRQQSPPASSPTNLDDKPEETPKIVDRKALGKSARMGRYLMNECIRNSRAEGSLFSGGIGASVYLKMRMSQTLQNRFGGNKIKPLKSALEEATTALQNAESGRHTSHIVSILTSEYVSAKCLLAAVLYKLEDIEPARQHAEELIQWLGKTCKSLPESVCDVMHGRAGALQAIWFLREELEDPSIGHAFVLACSQSILVTGLKNAEKSNCESLLIWEKRGKSFLGAAHGMVGILQSLLGLTEEEWADLESCLPCAKDVVRHSINNLEGLCHPSGNLRATFAAIEEDKRTDWAHGSPGYCLLLIKASEVFNDVAYLDLAMDMGENVVWARRVQRKNLGLCTGVSGIGYVFLALARADPPNSEMWRERAERCAYSAVDDVRTMLALSTRPYSLFEGLAGLVALLLDLSSPDTAHFPFYESRTKECIGWNSKNTTSVFVAECKVLGSASPGQKLSKQEEIEGKVAEAEVAAMQVVQDVLSTSVQAKKKQTNCSKISQRAIVTPSPRKENGQRRDECTKTNSNKSIEAHSPQTESTDEPRAEANACTEAVNQWDSSNVEDLLDKQTENSHQEASPAALKRDHGGYNLSPQIPGLDSENHSGHSILLAQKFINACLRHNTAEGNLFSGGLGAWAYLQMRMTQHLVRKSECCQIHRMKPLKSALNAALEALQDAEGRRGKVYASVWTNGWTGAKCLVAAALYSSGDTEAAKKHASELIERLEKTSADLHPTECDVMHGRAGALQAIWFLRQELQDPNFGRSFALATSQKIVLEGIRTAKKNNDRLLLAWEWNSRTLLGAGRGVVGILHSILGHSEEELNILEERIPRVKLAIRHTIDTLEDLCHPSGNLRAALTGDEEDTMIEWAHGSTGYCLLLIKTYKVFGDIRYLNLAKDRAENVLWPRRSLRKSISLCRGISGIGYVFLALAQVDSTNHAMWRKRAEYYAQAAASNWSDLLTSSKRPYSLFEGLGGLAALLLDLENEEGANFPFYETIPRKDAIGVSQNGAPQVTMKQQKTPAVTFAKQKVSKPSADNVTATTASSTFGSPFKADRGSRKSCSMPVSPLTDPNVTPAKDRAPIETPPRNMSSDNGPTSPKRKNVSAKVFPPRKRMYKHTQPDHVPLAEKTTKSWQSKLFETDETVPRRPNIRKLLGAFGAASRDTH